MSPKQKALLLQALRAGTITFGAVVIGVAIVALMRNINGADLTGRALNAQERGVTPTAHFTAERTQQGFTVPADTHVIFTVPDQADIAIPIFLGGKEAYDNVRYWWYCFSGNEEGNRAANRTKRKLYDGKFGYSRAEIRAGRKEPPMDTDLIGILHSAAPEEKEGTISEIMVFHGGETCYVMSASPLAAGMDDDDDALNNAIERNANTSPVSPDTDGDGIEDGREIYITKTNPLTNDTDGDRLPDKSEDRNEDGLNNNGETSAKLSDTDRDGLCDGDGQGPGCPEPTSYPFRGEDLNMNGLVESGETDPRNADTDGDGTKDLDEKWNEIRGFR